MKLEILSPNTGEIFLGEVKSVKVPSKTGGFELLDNHTPIVALMSKGKIRIVDEKGKEKNIEIHGGVLESNNNNTIIFLDS